MELQFFYFSSSANLLLLCFVSRLKRPTRDCKSSSLSLRFWVPPLGTWDHVWARARALEKTILYVDLITGWVWPGSDHGLDSALTQPGAGSDSVQAPNRVNGSIIHWLELLSRNWNWPVKDRVSSDSFNLELLNWRFKPLVQRNFFLFCC